MPVLHQEKHFEAELAKHLADHGWLYSPDDTGYSRELALLPEDLIGYLKETQPAEWAKLKDWHNGSTETLLLERICSVMDAEGSLSVLRHPVKAVSARFELCQFKPSHGHNPDTTARYGKVRLRVMRQVHYSLHHEGCIDLVFFVNGIPVATAELKTDFTQSVQDAIFQYRKDRPPRDPATKKAEPLLTFKRRALVHFAVSTDQVYMTTELAGGATRFLPFNLGNDGAAGNPPNPSGYRTAYLWERVLQRDNWLRILGSFVHLERVERIGKDGKKTTKEGLIFPRFHQWEAVNKLIFASRLEGPGHTYLVQHSAGSGKTNSISWLAHQLSTLHDANDAKVYDSVIVITDRTVLDSQLQDAIYQFEHKHGVVARITSEHGAKTGKLADALKDAKPIIIVTLQTFPFLLEEIRGETSLKDRRFAVIVDEAHSSMSGASARKLRAVLTAEEVEEGVEITAEDLLVEEMKSRKLPPNVSFYAFTATPKGKTIELFGRRPDPSKAPGPENIPVPFHVYSMQQAIEEGFILDVLLNYTAYKVAYKIAHGGKEYDDKEVDKAEGAKQIARWVRLHPHNIAQKVAIVVEHFRANVAWRLNGEAKAMVVTGSRKEAVRYKIAIDKYIKDSGYKDIASLVAFSGDVIDPESGAEKFNEHTMNPGLKGRDIREAFDTVEFNVLLVANKYQTGFDQPKLMAMYVDKRLAGVSTVQTLSRLNRTFPGKEETFVLDFVNDPEAVRVDFEPFFKTAQLAGVSDPNIVHNIQTKLDNPGIYLPAEVEAFATAYYDPKGTQKTLQAIIAPAVERWRGRMVDAKKAKNEEAIDALELFVKDMGSFIRAYDFLSQIIDYGDTDLEKHYIFYKCLIPLLRDETPDKSIDLSALVLTHHKVRDLGKAEIGLGLDGEDHLLKPIGPGTGEPHPEEYIALSALIARMNETFEGELSDADKVAYVQHIAGKMMENESLAQQANQNTKQQFGMGDFHTVMMDAVIDGLDKYQSMAEQVMSNDKVKQDFAKIVLDVVYDGLKVKGGLAGRAPAP
jgi:type I restriction enzyme R subunit